MKTAAECRITHTRILSPEPESRWEGLLTQVIWKIIIYIYWICYVIFGAALLAAPNILTVQHEKLNQQHEKIPDIILTFLIQIEYGAVFSCVHESYRKISTGYRGYLELTS